MTTGSRMKSRRKETGVPVEEIASTLGVSVATIYRYENGDIEKVPGSLLEPLSKVLHTTPAYLMGWSDDPFGLTQKGAPTPDTGGGLSTEAKEVAHAYDKATEKEQRTVRLVLSDYLPDGTAPKDIAASNAPKELSREDVAQVIHPDTSAEIPE